jgi:hypothetical protein
VVERDVLSVDPALAIGAHGTVATEQPLTRLCIRGAARRERGMSGWL